MKHPTDFTLSTYFRLFMALNSTWPTQFELVFFRGAHKNGCKEIRGEEERDCERKNRNDHHKDENRALNAQYSCSASPLK